MPDEEKTGGKDEVSVPPTDTDTGGKDDAAGESPSPDEREQSVPRERFDEVLTQLHELRADVTASKTQQQSQQQPSWEQTSDQDLNYIVSHPTEYPDHVAKAIEEKEKRMETRILNKTNEQFAVQSFRKQNPDTFDVNTPLGKEVAKIMAQQSYSDTLSAVVELAEHRIGKNNSSSNARKKVVDNIKSATETVHGNDDNMQQKISFMDMPQKDFLAELQKVKMGNKI